MGGGASTERTKRFARINVERNKMLYADNKDHALIAYRTAGIAPHAKEAEVRAKIEQIQPAPEQGPQTKAQEQQLRRPRITNPSTLLDYYRNKLHARPAANRCSSAGEENLSEIGGDALESTAQRHNTDGNDSPPRPSGRFMGRIRPLRALKDFGHDREDDGVDPYSKKTWQDLDQVSAVMAAKAKAKQDELAAVRDMRKKEEEICKRIADAKKAGRQQRIVDVFKRAQEVDHKAEAAQYDSTQHQMHRLVGILKCQLAISITV